MRASLWRNLSPRRASTPRDALERALVLAGVAPADWPSGRVIDPDEDGGLDPIQARLRLARAIACRPAALVIAEPSLLQDEGLVRLARRIAAETGAAVICGALAGDVSAAA